ncbi:12905_t:CDS:2, partial [Dentiscutata heterogama]
GLIVSLFTIKLKIKELLRTSFQQEYPNVLETFKASNSWCQRFINRYKLVFRHYTKLEQKLLYNLAKQLDHFYEFIKKSQYINNYELFSKIVQIRTTDNEKNQFIYVLAILANRAKLPSMIIFKDKRYSRGPFLLGYFTDSVKAKYNELNMVRDIISSRLTLLVQPLD